MISIDTLSDSAAEVSIGLEVGSVAVSMRYRTRIKVPGVAEPCGCEAKGNRLEADSVVAVEGMDQG